MIELMGLEAGTSPMMGMVVAKLLEPLQYGFMQRSLLMAALMGVVCAVVGSYLMVQRLALLGDAISHSVLPGLAIAFLVGASTLELRHFGHAHRRGASRRM